MRGRVRMGTVWAHSCPELMLTVGRGVLWGRRPSIRWVSASLFHGPRAQLRGSSSGGPPMLRKVDPPHGGTSGFHPHLDLPGAPLHAPCRDTHGESMWRSTWTLPTPPPPPPHKHPTAVLGAKELSRPDPDSELDRLTWIHCPCDSPETGTPASTHSHRLSKGRRNASFLKKSILKNLILFKQSSIECF